MGTRPGELVTLIKNRKIHIVALVTISACCLSLHQALERNYPEQSVNKELKKVDPL